METAKINSFQLFSLMFMFELGSTIVVGVGLDVKQDAWLTILLGMASSIPLFFIYSYLFYQYPGHTLIGYIKNIVGKYIGIPLSLIYVGYFLYIAARVLRDFGDLLTTTTLSETPLVMVNGLMILLITYGVLMGIEVIGRTGEMIFIIILFLGVLGISSTVFSDIIKTENLTPFLENGLKPIITTVYTQTYTFPFGEMISFTMILPFLNKPKLGWRTGLLAILASGAVLSLTIALEISILGANTAAQSQFPLLQTISKVNIANFIQRLDIIVVATLILGVFIKISIFYYAGFLGIQDLFHLTRKKPRIYCILLLSCVILIASVKMAENFTEHIAVGLKWVPIYLHLPLQTGIPLLLFILTLIKKVIGRNKIDTPKVQS
ncbi:GerAB/ArcD/ProY family transporter [Neobacillus vireti]|uniref:GerAB/ArcD/ProY family transporter n=1 Tax=Neobacillus vireti TaxID=220686 RepID=UPI002FFF5EE3